MVTGNCGSGPIDVAKYLAAVDAHGAGTNVIHLVPHGSLRQAVMGMDDRVPTAPELERMKTLVRRGITAGAWGMATGLIYVPGCYASTAELTELARVVAGSGGIYASHIRDEEDGLLEAIDEAIAIGKSASVPVHISHLKANGKANWGKAASALERIAAARSAGQPVTADQYPYIASSTKLAAMVVPHWAIRGDGDEFGRLAATPDRGPLLRVEIQRELDRRDGGAAIRIARYAPRPGWVGRDLAAIAQRRGDHAAGSRARHPAPRRRSGDQLRHERERCAGHHAARLRRHGVRRIQPSARQRRPASSPSLRHVSAQDPLCPGRACPLARAGRPLLHRFTGPDSGPGRAGNSPSRRICRRGRVRPGNVSRCGDV